MNREKRLELNEKSKLAFGHHLEWQRKVRKGHLLTINPNRKLDKPHKRWYNVTVDQIEESMNQIIQKKGERLNEEGSEVRPGKTTNESTESISDNPNGESSDIRSEEIQSPQLARGVFMVQIERRNTKTHFRLAFWRGQRSRKRGVAPRTRSC